eukprot:Phypoly_transcript_08150.p1 GENE.Phypoly_transcript_08150~~Phypoly_transcript_08150.p1  ORF type:complete len:331 (+),score=53.65 Phypoly_transcript_08150:463-1455(+)
MSSLAVNTTTSTPVTRSAPRSPPLDNGPPNKRTRTLGAPVGFTNKFIDQAAAAILPNGSAMDRVVLAVFLQLVLKDLPKHVTADILEAHLQSNSLIYHSLSLNQFAEAIIKFLNHVEHLTAATHEWPWGEVCQRSVNAPFADYDGSNRITFCVPENFMSSPLACFSGALASLGATVEGGSWSEAKAENFNVDVETLDCARNIFRFRDSFIIEDMNGGKPTPVLLKRDKCALVHSSLAKVFVGNIRAGQTEIEVEDALIEVIRAGKIPPNNFIYFSVHRTKGLNSKASNFGFAHVIGEEVANFLCLASTQRDYASNFVVKQVKEGVKKQGN